MARFPEDILWRRSKLGLTMSAQECDALATRPEPVELGTIGR